MQPWLKIHGHSVDLSWRHMAFDCLAFSIHTRTLWCCIMDEKTHFTLLNGGALCAFSFPSPSSLFHIGPIQAAWPLGQFHLLRAGPGFCQFHCLGAVGGAGLCVPNLWSLCETLFWMADCPVECIFLILRVAAIWSFWPRGPLWHWHWPESSQAPLVAL